MTIHLDEIVLRGEFSNLRRNCVHGWIELANESIEGDPVKNEEYRFIHMEFTGNLKGFLAGKRFRFEAQNPRQERGMLALGEDFQDRQIGVIGNIEWSRPTRLTLEWFGQNGPISIELVDPIFEVDGEFSRLADPFPADPGEDEEWDVDSDSFNSIIQNQLAELAEADATESYMAASEEAELLEQDEDRDFEELQTEAFDLFDDYEDSDDPIPFEDGTDVESSAGTQGPLRAWDEIIPGIDPATKAMYEQWDEVTYGTLDEPVTWLFDGAYKLPRPDLIRDESEAEEALRILLAQLARCGIAFDMCEHFNSIDAYRLLVEEILPDATVHPRLISTGFVMHYSSCEHCKVCEAELYPEDFEDSDLGAIEDHHEDDTDTDSDTEDDETR